MDFDEEGNECIPQELSEAVEEGDHDDEEYEGYMGNVSMISFFDLCKSSSPYPGRRVSRTM